MYTLKDPSHSGDTDGMVFAGLACRTVEAEREIPHCLHAEFIVSVCLENLWNEKDSLWASTHSFNGAK